MSRELQQLASLAVLGTQTTQPPRFTLAEPELDALLQASLNQAGLRPAQVLLRQAALFSLLPAVAGPAPTALGDAAEPPPASTLPPLPDAAALAFQQALLDDDAELLTALLAVISDRGYGLPLDTWVPLLECARKRSEFRQGILRFADPGTRWLARQNDDWRFALKARVDGSDDTDFETAHASERPGVFERWRQRDATAALAALRKSWPELPPAERAGLLTLLATGFTVADEAFCESALKDKRKEVRVAAWQTLAAQPDSALCRRSTAWAASWFDAKANADTPAFALPTAISAEMIADAIEAKPPQGIGERAFWRRQVLERVHLPALCAQLGQPIDQLLVLLRKSQDGKAQLAALRDSVVRQRDAATARIWFRLFPKEVYGDFGWLPMASMLFGADPEGEARMIETLDGRTLATDAVHQLLQQDRGRWSDALMRAVQRYIDDLQERDAYHRRYLLATAALHAPLNQTWLDWFCEGIAPPAVGGFFSKLQQAIAGQSASPIEPIAKRRMELRHQLEHAL